MAKTTGGKKATGKGSREPTKRVTEAGSASTARGAGAAPATAARVTKAAARSAPKVVAKRASLKSVREAAAMPDDTAARDTQVSTVQPADVQQPRGETTAGTANSMTKKLNEVSVDDDAAQSEEQQPVVSGKVEKAKA